MEKIEIINVYSKNIILNLKITNRYSRSIKLSGGHFYIDVPKNYSLVYLKNKINSCVKEKLINNIYSSLFITSSYVDVLGIRRRLVVLKNGQERISKEDFVVEKEEDIEKVLKKLELDIISSRVKKYSSLMGINYEHNIKITNMRSALGKNYYTKHLLTFDHTLIHFSLEIIDAIVVHELAHCFEQNHSTKFYDIVLKYIPNYRLLNKKIIYGVRS